MMVLLVLLVLQELQALLPDTTTTIADVGKELRANLSALIAISWSPEGSRNQLEAVANEALVRMPKKVRSHRWPSLEAVIATKVERSSVTGRATTNAATAGNHEPFPTTV